MLEPILKKKTLTDIPLKWLTQDGLIHREMHDVRDVSDINFSCRLQNLSIYSTDIHIRSSAIVSGPE